MTLEELYDEHVWRVYAFFAYRLDSREQAEDLTQATFERAVRGYHRYDERRGSHLTWLMTIAQNLLVDHFRRTGTARTTPAEPERIEALAGAAPGSEEYALGLSPQIESALATLSDREREIVALRYGADLTGPEIAAIEGLTLANIQQILSRSLRRMRDAIEETRSRPAGPPR